jgi:redox-sensitive bicupin YhaK (pirin superfamily)
MQIRRSNERGIANHGWLKSYHSFSFANYYDPQWMGFANLRVINEDRIAAGSGFGTHGHRDMEIISYVLDGELAHKDSMGNVEVIRPGEVQRMSAGRGVMHSEFNHAKGQTHFLQIWIEPKFTGIQPSYEQKAFDGSEKRGKLRLVVSPDGAEGSVTANADARLYAGLIDGAERASLELVPGRHTYVHVVRGAVAVNDAALNAGDAAMWRVADDSKRLVLEHGKDAEVLVFDLAA